MIEFKQPPLQMGMSTFLELSELWRSCSSCAGFCISKGAKFFESGVKDVDNDILPSLTSAAPEGVCPRVLPWYATMFWFAKEVG